MTNLQIIILGLIQGLTEFLPVSSSAHLVLVPIVTGWPDQGLTFDTAVHLGTLGAVILYFRKEVLVMLWGWVKSLFTFKVDEAARLAWMVLLATIPVVLSGFFLKSWVTTLRAPHVIGWATIVFGILLGLSDWLGQKKITENNLKISNAIIIGLAQIISLIPGVSRSGVTLTAGLALGMTRRAAARFAFLMSIPVILGAASLAGWDLYKEAQVIDWHPFLLGMTVALLSGLLCIHWFIGWLERFGVRVFVLYRVLLGIMLLTLF